MPSLESDYKGLLAAHPSAALGDFADPLTDLWLADYRQTHGSSDIVSVTLPSHGTSFTYLFDIARSRNIVAYGMPIYTQDARDASRQKGHPLGAANGTYVRGHLIAHVLGGGMDINFIPQLRSTNGSAFKKVENEVRALAQANTRCFYFVRTLYAPQPAAQKPDQASQLPIEIEQCVINTALQLTYRLHKNL